MGLFEQQDKGASLLPCQDVLRPTAGYTDSISPLLTILDPYSIYDCSKLVFLGKILAFVGKIILHHRFILDYDLKLNSFNGSLLAFHQEFSVLNHSREPQKMILFPISLIRCKLLCQQHVFSKTSIKSIKQYIFIYVKNSLYFMVINLFAYFLINL